MSECIVLHGEAARDFFAVADVKTGRYTKRQLEALAADLYPEQGREDETKRPIDDKRDRRRYDIAEAFAALYTVLESVREVRVLEIVPVEDVEKRYGF